MDTKELNALIALLDDTDEEVYGMVSARIKSLGEEVIPRLEEAWESSFDHLIQQRIEDIIHSIQLDSLTFKLEEWTRGEQDLLTGAFLVARYQYPDMDEEPLKKLLDQLYRQAQPEIKSRKTSAEKIQALNHIFYDVFGFTGNKSNLHAPHNYFINHVLETKKGNHISLGIIYIHIAGRCGIRVEGINLPDHFILGVMEEDPVKKLFNLGQSSAITPSFYMNPFSKGAIFGAREIDHYLKQVGEEPSEKYHLPSLRKEIIRRMFMTLAMIYRELGFTQKVEELTNLASILNH